MDRYLEIWNLVFQTEDLSEVRAKDCLLYTSDAADE